MPSLSMKKHLFKQTEIYSSTVMIAYAPEGYFADLACSHTVGLLYGYLLQFICHAYTVQNSLKQRYAWTTQQNC